MMDTRIYNTCKKKAPVFDLEVLLVLCARARRAPTSPGVMFSVFSCAVRPSSRSDRTQAGLQRPLGSGEWPLVLGYRGVSFYPRRTRYDA